MKEINYLKEGGTIELVAPSFGCASEVYGARLTEAIKNLKLEGFKIKEGKNIYLAKRPYRSNSAKECAKEFMDAYLANDSDAIISVGGGEVMCDILPYIDFNKIKKAPHKLFMGFSDNTNLTFTLPILADVPTIYGPCACSFAYKPFLYNIPDALDLIKGKRFVYSGYPYWERHYIGNKDELIHTPNYTEPKVIKTYPTKEVSFSGMMIGGCLDILVMLCGTKFDKVNEFIERHKDEGIVWYLESCDLNTVGIKRAMFQLTQAGWFKYAKGFIIGRPLCYRRKQFGITHVRAFNESLKPLHVPYILDADLGHFAPSMPLLCGVKGNVEAKDNNIKIEYCFD